MSVARIISIGVVVWVSFYLLVYVMFVTPTPKENAATEILSTNRNPRNLKNTPFDKPLVLDPIIISRRKATETEYIILDTDPFVSTQCASTIFSAQQQNSATVVIIARNEPKSLLMKTVSSVVKNSNGLLSKIVIVDDYSTDLISVWGEWTSPDFSSFVRVVRPEKRLGVAGAKNFGAQQASSEFLVFLDAHVVVSSDWLSPLCDTLTKHSNALVYPAIDIIDPDTSDLIKGSNVLGGFDWGMAFRWEPADGETFGSRLGLSMPAGPDTVTRSPAAPGILAVKSSYFKEIGGFDTNLYPWGQDSVELSMRTWMCGGMVLRQPCSRVAHRYANLHDSSAVANGVTKGEIDLNVMIVAEHWLDPKYKEISFMSRFSSAMPYKVEVSKDMRNPKNFYGIKALRDEACENFDWYMSEIYPGLKLDVGEVEAAYRNFLASSFETDTLKPWISQYNKNSQISYNSAEVALLDKRASAPAEKEVARQHNQLYPPLVERPKKKAATVVVEKSPATDPHEIHANKVREELLCEDESFSPVFPCSKMAGANKDSCVTNRYYMMFGCPKTCGLCGTDGKLCVDFYEKKCPEWKMEGKCEREPENMAQNCRLTCGVCQRKSDAVDAAINRALAAAGLGRGEGNQVAALKPIPGISPFTAQELYAAGKLPDVPPSNPCSVNGVPNGQILARMSIAESAPKSRIFCGIYTMEKNHKTNVKATVETWAKKCDGFMAFSTVDDPSLPAMFIQHEGEEAYENMWQKSRSIWKYIAENYIDHFDYFLLGGDDMFYVIENFRKFLDSDEIQNAKNQEKGLFIGRRFFPPGQEVFNSGGAGYTLDKVSLRILKDNIDTPKCFPHQKGFWEDVNVANCLRVSSGIMPYDTRDPLQRERFHPFTPGQHLTYRIPPINPDWYTKYNPELKIGFECCSAESVSFHYCPEKIMRELHGYLYHCHAKKP